MGDAVLNLFHRRNGPAVEKQQYQHQCQHHPGNTHRQCLPENNCHLTPQPFPTVRGTHHRTDFTIQNHRFIAHIVITALIGEVCYPLKGNVYGSVFQQFPKPGVFGETVGDGVTRLIHRVILGEEEIHKAFSVLVHVDEKQILITVLLPYFFGSQLNVIKPQLRTDVLNLLTLLLKPFRRPDILTVSDILHNRLTFILRQRFPGKGCMAVPVIIAPDIGFFVVEASVLAQDGAEAFVHLFFHPALLRLQVGIHRAPVK